MKNLMYAVEFHANILFSTLYPQNYLSDPIEMDPIDVTIEIQETTIRPYYFPWCCLSTNRWLAHNALYIPNIINFNIFSLFFWFSAFLKRSKIKHTMTFPTDGMIKAILTSFETSGIIIRIEHKTIDWIIEMMTL